MWKDAWGWGLGFFRVPNYWHCSKGWCLWWDHCCCAIWNTDGCYLLCMCARNEKAAAEQGEHNCHLSSQCYLECPFSTTTPHPAHFPSSKFSQPLERVKTKWPVTLSPQPLLFCCEHSVQFDAVYAFTVVMMLKFHKMCTWMWLHIISVELHLSWCSITCHFYGNKKIPFW